MFLTKTKKLPQNFFALLEKYKADGRSTPTDETVTIDVKPLPELIDVWDAAKVRARGPILIAHRGGVVGSGTPECSRKAVKLAAVHNYDMVELDVRESQDHHPVVFHDQNMMRACGIDGAISDFSLEAITQIRFLNSSETVTSLDNMLRLCRSLNLGIMFDIKSGEGSDLFFQRVLTLIDKYDLDKACMTPWQLPSKRIFEGKSPINASGQAVGKGETR